MKQILCLAPQDWSSTPGRTQQLVSRLRDVQILYFAPAKGNWDRSWKEPGRKVRPNITVYTLPPLGFHLGEQYAPLFRARYRRISRFINEKVARHRFRNPLLWTTSPYQVHLLDELTYRGLVFDCDREWDEVSPEWEGSLAYAADVVFVASRLLADRLAPCSSNIAIVPNGVNYPLFAAPPGPALTDILPGVTGPVLGWAGTIRPELDLTPILTGARERPDWTFLLLGRREGHPQLGQLKGLPNVVLEGPVPLTEVPDWLGRCHVLVDLLHTDRREDGVVSTRVYEYLSTGKPVVSMLWEEQVEIFPDVVYGAYHTEDFISLCGKAMEEAPGFVSQRRRSYGESASWSVRSGEVARILTTAGLL